MLKLLDLTGVLASSGSSRANQLHELLPRPVVELPNVDDVVFEIVRDVKERGNAAVRDWTKRREGYVPDAFRVPQELLDAALRDISPHLREALEIASQNITAFQRATRPEETQFERNGMQVREVWQPVERVGCYVCGGGASLPSAVLSTALPARSAGVRRISLCVAPDNTAVISPAVLAAAAMCEVDDVFAVGGPEAIAAMAYGTESIDTVDVICGSGEPDVMRAMRSVVGVVGLPSATTGPSEIVVVADETTPANIVAIDLAAQAERGLDSLAWLVTWSQETAARVDDALRVLLERTPESAHITHVLESNGCCVLVDDAQAAMDVVNAIAPENLEIMTIDPEALLPLVRHASTVFAGEHSPASLGKYLAGPSHLLPTFGSARFGSALSVRDFLRAQHIVKTDEESLTRLSPHVRALGESEGFYLQAESARMRNA